MTLFTLAGALISASHVCCVAPLSAHQRTTSAAPHNRSFEGFLSLSEKKKTEKGQQQQQKGGNNREEVGGKFSRAQADTRKRTQSPLPTYTNGHDSWSFLLLQPLHFPPLIGFSLFRTN